MESMEIDENQQVVCFIESRNEPILEHMLAFTFESDRIKYNPAFESWPHLLPTDFELTNARDVLEVLTQIDMDRLLVAIVHILVRFECAQRARDNLVA